MLNLTLCSVLVISVLNAGERDASRFCAFHAKISSVIDGDTIIVAPLSASLCSTASREKVQREFTDDFPYYIRLIGIDTPERGEKDFKKARRFVLRWIEANPQFMVVYALHGNVPTLDKYGRLLGSIVPRPVPVLRSPSSAALRRVDTAEGGSDARHPPVSLNAEILAAGLAKTVHYKHNDTINFIEWQIRKNSEPASSKPTAP